MTHFAVAQESAVPFKRGQFSEKYSQSTPNTMGGEGGWGGGGGGVGGWGGWGGGGYYWVSVVSLKLVYRLR